MLSFLLGVVIVVLGLVIGGVVLLTGRRAIWISLAIVGLVATGNLLAVIVAGLNSGLDLIRQSEWLLVAIAVGVGALGWYIGQTRRNLATALIGIVAGVDMALWLREIIQYISSGAGPTGEGTAVLLNLPAILIGGLLGWWFVRAFRDEALILLTVIMGVEIIYLALGLSSSRAFTAVILLSLALAGVVVQYADYLRGVKAQTPLDPISQELEAGTP
ncbi:MAG: hypothetical protein KC441_16135 [Anaerolineales bacterium]|nr:hypothetical protein [Anaerolineales bacterium]